MNMNQNWNDFSNADEQVTFELIPKGTLAKVTLKIKPGGYSNPEKGWTGNWATHSPNTGAVFLNCEFNITAGHYAGRKVWSLIGLHSEKGDNWANTGRSFIKGILCSARNIDTKESSPKAQRALCIDNFGELNGLTFLARIDVDKQSDGTLKNVIKIAITPEHKEYPIYMNTQTNVSVPTPNTSHINTSDEMPPWAQ